MSFMNLVRRSSGVLCIAWSVLHATASDDGTLRLIARIDATTSTDRVSARNGKLYFEDGSSSRPVPMGATWTLEGDFAAHAAYFCLAPDYALSGRPIDFSKASIMRWPFGVTTWSALKNAGWAGSQAEDGIVVAVWIQDDRPALVTVLPASRAAGIWDVCALDEGQIEGRLVLLLRKADGLFALAEPEFRDPVAQQTLQAMSFGKPAQVEHLIGSLRDPNTRGRDRLTLLHMAARDGNAAVVSLLLGRGADRDVTSESGNTPFLLATVNGRRRVIGEFLAAHTRDAGKVPRLDGSIDRALGAGHAGAAFDLLLSQKDWKRRRPTLGKIAELASQRGPADVLHAFATHGVERLCSDVKPVLILSHMRLGRNSIVQAMIENGADPDAADEYCSLLHLVVARPDTGLLGCLLEHGAKPNVKDHRGDTPLHLAARAGDGAAVEVLLRHGADPNSSDARGHTPLDLALETRAQRVAMQLRAGGARLRLRAPDASRQLTHLIANNDSDLLAGAVSDGWSPQEPLFDLWPPAQVATLLEAENARRWLIDRGASAIEIEVYPRSETDNPPSATKTVPRQENTKTGGARAEAMLEVAGLIDAGGRFLFPRIVGVAENRHAVEVLRAAWDWRLTPVTKAGRPVAVLHTRKVLIPVLDDAIHEASEVDQPAVPVEPVVFSASAAVLMMPQITFSDTTRSSPSGPGQPAISVHAVETNNNPMANVTYKSGEWALVHFVVETDGTVSFAEALSGSAVSFALGTVEVVRRTKFHPAKLEGRPVRMRFVEHILAEP